jgi:hypothetical protein
MFFFLFFSLYGWGGGEVLLDPLGFLFFKIFSALCGPQDFKK